MPNRSSPCELDRAVREEVYVGVRGSPARVFDVAERSLREDV